MGALDEEMVRGLQGVTAEMACRGCVPKPAVSGVGVVKLRRARVELDKGRVSGRGTGVWVRRGGGGRVGGGAKEYRIGPGRRIGGDGTWAQVIKNRRNGGREDIVVGGSV